MKNKVFKFILLFGFCETIPLLILLLFKSIMELTKGEVLATANLMIIVFLLFEVASLFVFKARKKAGFVALFTLYFLRLLKFHSPFFFFNMGYGFNFYFDFTFHMQKGDVLIGLNIVSMIMMFLLCHTFEQFKITKKAAREE